jgi:pyridoxine/pyridoxamine 5'-phosphate oxidase
MMRRRGGRGIIGTMATTAVVAGTAGAVSHRQQQRYANKAAEQQAQAAQQQAAVDSQKQVAELQHEVASLQAQQPVPTPAPAGGTDVMAQLQQLSNMQAAGLLSPEQFEAAKNKLLGV